MLQGELTIYVLSLQCLNNIFLAKVLNSIQVGWFFVYFLGIFVIFYSSAASQRPTCGNLPTPLAALLGTDRSLQVGEMPDSNPELQDGILVRYD